MYNWQPFDASAAENAGKHLSIKCELDIGRAGNGNMAPPVSYIAIYSINIVAI